MPSFVHQVSLPIRPSHSTALLPPSPPARPHSAVKTAATQSPRKPTSGHDTHRGSPQLETTPLPPLRQDSPQGPPLPPRTAPLHQTPGPPSGATPHLAARHPAAPGPAPPRSNESAAHAPPS